MNFLKYGMGLVVAMALTACGGGGGSAGTTPGVTETTPPAIAASTTVSDFIFELDKTSVFNTGSDKAVLTVIVLDKNRNVVAGIPVSVSVDAGGVFAGSAGTTDASGKVTGTISIGGDKSNRTINATITVSNITKVASIVVTGSRIAVTPVPAAPTPGQLVTLNIYTVDSAGSPIQNASLTLTGTAGASGSIKTDASGSQIASFIAPSVAGSYDVVATGLGVTTTKVIQVISAGVGVADAVGPISSASLSPTPTLIPANAVGTTTNRSKLSAKFLTSGNVGIQNLRVRFVIVPPALGSGEVISVGDGTVYTDASGVAEADYIAGTRSSPTNGVNVRACYKLTDFNVSDFTSDGMCPSLNSVSASLTVAGAPLSISISDDNKMEKGLGEIAYLKKFLIQVNDAAGVAVKDAIISASVDITHYGKGVYGGIYSRATAPTINDTSLALVRVGSTLPPVVSEISGVAATSTSPLTVTDTSTSPSKTYYYNIWCANEDINRNGFRDAGDDTNGDGILQPRKAEIIVSYVNGNKTDANGQMLVQITYGQNMGSWLAYTLRATTGVAGSEGDASKSYVTHVLEGDVINGSFRTPPFGSNACNTLN